MIKRLSERSKRWLMVGLWVACIYSTLYIVVGICNFLLKNTPFSFLVNFGLIGLFAAIVILFLRKVKGKRRSTYILLSLIFVMYLTALQWLKLPAERIHLPEYGLLAFLLYRALILDLKAPGAYIAAFILTALLGWGDEGIQYILPNRYYELRDVMINTLSGGMGLLLTFVMQRK